MPLISVLAELSPIITYFSISWAMDVLHVKDNIQT